MGAIAVFFLPLLEATDDNRFGGPKAQTLAAEFA
jgi:hypothetical protein